MVKFRELKTSSGKIVFLGRNAENNEELVRQVEDYEMVLHTAKPGSPFTNVKGNWKELSKKDIHESALFCARYSKDWRDNRKDVIVHVFLGKDIFKLEDMNKGTFGVKKYKEIKIKKEEIAKFNNS